MTTDDSKTIIASVSKLLRITSPSIERILCALSDLDTAELNVKQEIADNRRTRQQLAFQQAENDKACEFVNMYWILIQDQRAD
jgi:hypothetical protein